MIDHSPKRHRNVPQRKIEKEAANSPVINRQWTEEERQRVSSEKPPKGEKPFLWGSKKS